MPRTRRTPLVAPAASAPVVASAPVAGAPGVAPAPAVASAPPAPLASITRVEDYCVGRFTAMGGPCEVLLDGEDAAEAGELVALAEQEALRIERKFSRYRTDNVVHELNHAGGRPIAVDHETAMLIDYATTCYDMSDGRFDITSGVLRRVWTFDGSHRVPAPAAVLDVLRHVGWHRASWENSTLTMPDGMEIDLGGIGKEYAVDRAATLLGAHARRAFLVNFGGDLYASGPRSGDRPWVVGVDDPGRTGEAALYRIDLSRGGLATSGDARRYVIHEGRRLGHILDPRTGWPVADAPRSVTVLAGTCLEAGTLATLACLQGRGAREFLEQQDVVYRIV